MGLFRGFTAIFGFFVLMGIGSAFGRDPETIRQIVLNPQTPVRTLRWQLFHGSKPAAEQFIKSHRAELSEKLQAPRLGEIIQDFLPSNEYFNLPVEPQSQPDLKLSADLEAHWKDALAYAGLKEVKKKLKFGQLRVKMRLGLLNSGYIQRSTILARIYLRDLSRKKVQSSDTFQLELLSLMNECLRMPDSFLPGGHLKALEAQLKLVREYSRYYLQFGTEVDRKFYGLDQVFKFLKQMVDRYEVKPIYYDATSIALTEAIEDQLQLISRKFSQEIILESMVNAGLKKLEIGAKAYENFYGKKEQPAEDYLPALVTYSPDTETQQYPIEAEVKVIEETVPESKPELPTAEHGWSLNEKLAQDLPVRKVETNSGNLIFRIEKNEQLLEIPPAYQKFFKNYAGIAIFKPDFQRQFPGAWVLAPQFDSNIYRFVSLDKRAPTIEFELYGIPVDQLIHFSGANEHRTASFDDLLANNPARKCQNFLAKLVKIGKT